MKIIVSIVLLAAALLVAPWQRTGEIRLAGQEFTVATFNIRYGTANDGENSWSNRRDLCIGVLQSLDADIVGLQEALDFQLDEMRGTLPGYVQVGVGRDDGLRKGEHAALLVRADRYAIDRSATTWLSDTPDVPGSKHWGNGITRVVTWARLIDLHSGRALWVYNVHLDHQSQASRERSVELVSQLMHERPFGDEPVIVMGDFNADEGNKACQYMRGDLISASGREGAPPSPGLVDSFRVVHAEATGIGTFNGFKDERGGEMIDHIFASPSLRVIEAGIDRTRGDKNACPSDHDAVWAKFAFDGQPPAEEE
ncbi:MAG: endonuclease/exonuclease/phosphatase family protein [Phycisphaerales bacterium]|nr:endonuclease/exonuclease/phosphatase family protein [Phycisphaerales bacterium]